MIAGHFVPSTETHGFSLMAAGTCLWGNVGSHRDSWGLDVTKRIPSV